MRLVLGAAGIVLVAVLVAEKLKSSRRAQSLAKQHQELAEIKVDKPPSTFADSSPVDTTTMITYPQWILFGDSITQQSFCSGGLGQHLADAYQRKIDIVNRGYSGYNSRWALRVAPHVFPRTKTAQQPFKAITMWWGANDACLPMRTQSIPLSEFKQNLHKFIEMLRSPSSDHYNPDTTIFLISPPPICVPQRAADVERRFGPGLELDRSFERTKDFAQAVKEVAQECKVSYVPAFEAIMHAAGPDYDTGLTKYLSDGLHLTPAGYQVVVAALFELLQVTHSELLPDNIPRLFPGWDEIDPKDPDASIPKP